MGWVVPKARLYHLCGISFKSGPTPTHHSPAASVGLVTWSLSLLEDKTVEHFFESWEEDILGIYLGKENIPVSAIRAAYNTF